MIEAHMQAKTEKQTMRPMLSTKMLVLAVLLVLPSCCHCFLTTSVSPISATPSTSRISMVYNHDLRDPDMMEMFIGGERYENVPLPDSMLDTTIFVGNLCEFAKDEDLSQQFRSVTNLISLPACVARRPNSQSLKYGFVAFPTVEEKEVGSVSRGDVLSLSINSSHVSKLTSCFLIQTNFLFQAAILRFHGTEFMGRRLKVEEILDHPRNGRVNVPEKLVTYVLGAAKKTPRGKTDFSLRKTSNPSKAKRKRGGPENSYSSNKNGSTQGQRKGDRKQKRANHKKRRRRNRDNDFFY